MLGDSAIHGPCTPLKSLALEGALPVLDLPDHQELLTLNFLSGNVKRIGKGKARGRRKEDNAKKHNL